MSGNRSLALAAALMAAVPAWAQDSAALPESVDLPALLRIVREVSPRLAVERQSVTITETNRIAAGAYPNPTVSYGYTRQGGGQQTVFSGRRQDQATFELPLLIAGQRGARIEKAEREIEAARARVAAGASSLAAEVGVGLVALQAAQDKAALQSNANEELERLRGIVAGRTDLGMASRYDLARIEVELGSARTKLEDARGDIADRSGNLAALLGIPNWRPKAAGSLAPLPVAADAHARARERALASPAAASALQEEKAAQSTVDLARRERWPVPSLSLGHARTAEPYGAANILGLSVEIPLLDTRRGPQARAAAEAAGATMRRELVVAETTATLERYANVIIARQAALQRFDTEAASRLPALKDMAENAYRLGRGTIFELLDSTRSRHEMLQARIDLLAALAEAQVRYLATSGELEPAGQR